MSLFAAELSKALGFRLEPTGLWVALMSYVKVRPQLYQVPEDSSKSLEYICGRLEELTTQILDSVTC